MKSLISQLHGLEINLVEDIIIAILLKSLPHEEFGNIVTTLKLLPNPTMASIEAALLEEEKKMKKLGMAGDMENAYYIKRSSTSKGSTSNKAKGVCNFCGKPGHYEKECYIKKKILANIIQDKEEDHDGHTNEASHEANICYEDSYAF